MKTLVKIFAVVFAVITIITCCFVAFSKNEKESEIKESPYDISLSDFEELSLNNKTSYFNWQNDISINDVSIKLPCKWTFFKNATGFDFESQDYKYSNLKGYCSDLVYLRKGEKTIRVQIGNTTNTDKRYTECSILGVFSIETDDNIEFDGDLRIGKTVENQDTLSAMYGKPYLLDDENDSSYSLGWAGKEIGNFKYTFTVKVENHKIVDIQMLTVYS